MASGIEGIIAYAILKWYLVYGRFSLALNALLKKSWLKDPVSLTFRKFAL